MICAGAALCPELQGHVSCALPLSYMARAGAIAANEEIGISTGAYFLRLDTLTSVRVTEFEDSHLWGEEIYVIPQYCFGVLVRETSLVLSDEHSDYRWLKYEEAYCLVNYDSNRTALWELNQRLKGKGPRG